MNREIKFRAWDKQYKKMVEVTDLYFDTEELDYKGNTSEPKMMYHYELMQYTGLKDKNGTEIYEGDIVKIHNYNTTWKYAQPSFDWRIFEIKYNVYTWAFNNEAIYMPMSDYSTYDGTPYDIEIIGNIHENPNLLIT